jgi:hypothetical protein
MVRISCVIVIALANGCKTDHPETQAADEFRLLTIPQSPVGHCEKGVFRGDFMEGAPPRGSVRVALDIGNVLSRGRSVRVILDSAGHPLSFRDELIYDTAGLSISQAISVAFNPDGSVRSGMAHHHERRGDSSSTDKDSALSSERYSTVVEAARQLRERCGG